MLTHQKDKFLIEPDITYLNCAYMGPLTKEVSEAGMAAILQKTRPYRVDKSHFFDPAEALKIEYGKIINASEPQRIALLPSVSYGMATIARNVKIKAGEEMIIVEGQFPSNVYAWQRLAMERGAKIITITPPDTWESRGQKWNYKIIDAIGPKTKLVAIGQVHWADGTLFSLEHISKKCKEHGALLIIDGSQSIGAMPFDLEKIKPDAVICAGYKWLLGPYSIALGWFGPAFDNGIPIEENWINRKNSEQFENLVNYTDEYRPLAGRYNAGEYSNFILVAMLLQSLKQINEWGVANIQSYCQCITEKPLQQIAEAGYFVEEPTFRGGHLFGIGLRDTAQMQGLKHKLAKANILVSQRGNFIRVSPHLYNSEVDLNLLAKYLIC